MNILAILFAVTLGVFAWRWHNQSVSPHTQPRVSPTKPSAMRPKAAQAPHSQDTVLALLVIGALLAGIANAAEPPRASEHSVPATDATAVIQMTSDRSPGRTAAPTKPAPTPPARATDPAELPRVGTKPVKPQLPPISREPFHNQWNAKAHPMQKGPAGVWRMSAPLKPGRCEYRFVVDGRWLDDPMAKTFVPNPHGGRNAVREVS